MVVLFHAGVPGISGGYAGVDVFFVLSGFLITGLLLREWADSGTMSLIGFYARRARRILPAATLVLFVTVAVSYQWLGFLRAEAVADDARWTALFALNFKLATGGADYFAMGQLPSPLQHFWSLAVEEQFYVLWPLLFLAVATVAPRAELRSKLLFFTLALILASFGWSVIRTDSAPNWAYFSPLTRAWEFGVGGALAAGSAWVRRVPFRAGPWLSWGGFLAVIASALVLDGSTAYPGYAASLPVLGTALAIVGGTVASGAGAERILGLRPFQVLGSLSYSLYLWHWPVLRIAAERAGAPLSVADNLLLVGIAFALAHATHYLIENPIRHGQWFTALPARALALGAVLSVAAFTFSSVQIARYWDDSPLASLGALTTSGLPQRRALYDSIMADSPSSFWLAEATGRQDLRGEAIPRLRPGTVLGAPSLLPREGASSAEFDGQTAQLLMGDVYDFPELAPMSIEMFLSPDQLVDDGRIVDKHDGESGWALRAFRGGVVNFVRCVARQNCETVVTVAGALKVGGPVQHLVVTFDGSIGRIWIDGVELGADPLALNIPGNDAELRIGGKSPGHSFDGRLEYVAAYDRALTPDEIAEHHRLAPGDRGRLELEPAASLADVLALVAAAPSTTSLPADLIPTLETAWRDWPGRLPAARECLLDIEQFEFGECTWGDPEGERSIVLVGDSHAGVWLSTFDVIGKRLDAKVVVLSKAGCPPVRLRHTIAAGGRQVDYVQCTRWQELVIARINEVRPDLLVLAASQDYGHDDVVWADGLRGFLSMVTSEQTKVAILSDVPTFRQSAGECLAAAGASIQECSELAATALGDKANLERQWKGVAAEVGAAYIDVQPWFCTEICTPVIGNMLAIRDTNHVSATYSLYLSGVMGSAIEPLLAR